MRLLKTAASLIVSEIDRDDVLLLVGVTLLVIGLWPLAHVASLIAPGAVFTWMSLPPRVPFVKGHRDAESDRRS